MSNITKKSKKVNASGLRKNVFTQNNPTEISKRKGGIRTEVEAVVADEAYDIYDLAADMANALNEIIAADASLTGPAVTKYKTRQAQIAKITAKY